MERVKIHLTGVLDSYGYQRSELQYYLNKNAGKPVLLIVNSYGGDVNEGLKISKMLEDHGDVVVRFIGCCASAVTWMAFGAKGIEIAQDAFMLIHQCSNAVLIWKSMKVADIDAKIRELESMKKSQEAFNLIIAKKYYERAESKGKTFEDVCKLMEEERWMTADEAAEWGLVDKVIPGINKMTKEQQNCIVQNCVAMNLPSPAFPKDDEEPGIVSQILDGIKSLLNPSSAIPAANAAAAPAEPKTNVEENKSNSNPIFSMKKLFVNICALLAIAANEQTEEAKDVTLTDGQLQKLENGLAEGKQAKDELQAILDTLNGVSENIKAIDGVKNKVHALVALVQNFPITAPAGNKTPQTSDTKQQAIKDSAKDPINEEVQNIYAHQVNGKR